MRLTSLRSRATGLLPALALLAFAFTPAQAGPELLCWPFDIEGAESLPMGTSGWRATVSEYPADRVVNDTLRILAADTPVLVRMETLRRAVVYARESGGTAGELLSRLEERVRASEKGGKADALALFDLGYFVEARRQGSFLWGVLASLQGLDGHEMAEKALALRGSDPQMEFAAALLAHVRDRETASKQHLSRALAGAATDRLLARNLISHAPVLHLPAGEIAALEARHGS